MGAALATARQLIAPNNITKAMRGYFLSVSSSFSMRALLFSFYFFHSYSIEECPIDADLLIKALGGKDNITALEASPSKLKATLKQDKDLDIETIKTLGASGIVAGHLTLTMIFGKASSVICETVLEKIK